ncbi:MAG: starch-binding protein [Bacilli bacterium]|nr:starch-binding protein [Bacilli bacterium]
MKSIKLLKNKLFITIFSIIATSSVATGAFLCNKGIINNNNQETEIKEAKAANGLYETVDNVEYRVIYFNNHSTLGVINSGDPTNGIMHFAHDYYDWRYKYTCDASSNLDVGNGTTVEFGNADATGLSFNEVIGDFAAKIYLPKDVKKVKFRITSEGEDNTVRAETPEYTLSNYDNTDAFIITTNNYSSSIASTGIWTTKTIFDSYFYTNYFLITSNWNGGNYGITSCFVRCKATSTGDSELVRTTPITINMVSSFDDGKRYAKFLVPSESGAKIRLQNAYGTWDVNSSGYGKENTPVNNYYYCVTGNSGAPVGGQGTTYSAYSEKSSYSLVGSGSFVDTSKGSEWKVASGTKMNFGVNDKGVLTNQYLEAGDVFEISNGINNYGWNANDSSTDKVDFSHTSFYDKSATKFTLYFNIEDITEGWSHWWRDQSQNQTAAYLYNSSTGENNGWPGVKMTYIATDWFAVDITLDRAGQYTHVIFNDQYGSSTNHNQTEDLSLPDMINNNGYWGTTSGAYSKDGKYYIKASIGYSDKCDNIRVNTTGYYNIYFNSNSNVYIEPSLGGAFYLDLDSINWEADKAVIKAEFKNSASDSVTETVIMAEMHGHDFTHVYDEVTYSNHVYETAVPKLKTGVPNRIKITRVNPDNEEDIWNTIDWLYISTSVSGKNVFKLTDWNTGTWSTNITHEQRANYYGNYFQSNIGCSQLGLVEPTGTWSVFKTEYNNMCLGAQGVAWLAAPNEKGTNIEHAMATYDYIIAKYKTTKYPDFINRRDSNSGSVLLKSMNTGSVFKPFDLSMASEDNMSIIIVVIASSVALLSLTALSVLVVKKRKRN